MSGTRIICRECGEEKTIDHVPGHNPDVFYVTCSQCENEEENLPVELKGFYVMVESKWQDPEPGKMVIENAPYIVQVKATNRHEAINKVIDKDWVLGVFGCKE